ncbi:hypothetical protein KBP30_07380 [Streptomyces sp. Go40/10]|uniref:hypothetical protein n=1 Tax=Streptomyces sp. Go40/10 TaxID=2825844 RepID=UPI001E4A9F85|nr:hypothetical protein [Streptomyces sp. Go40/10]UFR01009.1 hypothetical protein KBP30_07380 [Streptomyces sp. Go40/10]
MQESGRHPGPPPDEEGKKSGIGKRIAAAIGVLAGIAGIISLILTWISTPGPFTLSDWAAEADGTCDRDFGNLAASLTNANDEFSFALASWQAGNPNQQLFNYAGNLYFSAGGYYRKLSGELAQIHSPKDGKPDVQNIITTLEKMSTELYKVGQELRQVDFATGTAAGYVEQARQDANTSAGIEAGANALLKDVGAEKCAV